MSTYKDLTGKKFGRLVVLKRVKSPDNDKNHAYFLCKCDCGNEAIVTTGNLKSKSIISCGCYPKGVIPLPNGRADAHKLFRNYKFKAKRKNISFELSVENFLELTSQNCFYCGKPPSQIRKSSRTKNSSNYTYNGIDRINSNIGYTIKNTVTCCWVCNRAKSTMMQKDFFEWISIIYRNLKSKNLLD